MRSFQTGQLIHVPLSLNFFWAIANLNTGADSPCVPRAGENLGHVSICFAPVTLNWLIMWSTQSKELQWPSPLANPAAYKLTAMHK